MLVFCKFLFFFIIVTFLFFNADAAQGKTWVIASSSYDGGTNRLEKYYALQTSVYKVYQLFRDAGIPDDNIILMSNDDIGDEPDNPMPGVVYYGASRIDNATNYYDGVKVDYPSMFCRGSTFLDVLSGKQEGFLGKKLKSGPNDTIILIMFHFLYTGSVIFGPYGGIDFIEPHQIIEAIDELHEKKRFKKMLIYSENSYSTSLSFEGYLKGDKNVLAISAGGLNRHAYFCDRNDVLQYETSLCRTRLFFDYLTKLRKGNYTEGKTLYDLLSGTKKFSKHHKEFNRFQVFGNLKMLGDKLEDYFGNDLSDPSKYSNYYNRELDLSGLKNPKRIIRLEDLQRASLNQNQGGSMGNSINEMLLGHFNKDPDQ